MLIATRNAVLAALLTVVSGSALAEWVKVGASATDTLYVDPAAVRWSDNRAKMWVLNDFNSAQRHDGDEPPFMSQKAEYEYDCKQAQSRLLYFTSHSERMAQGEVVDFNVVPGDWVPVSSNSGLEGLWKIACGRA